MKKWLQILFLIIFITLIMLGRIQLWVGIFIVTALATPFLGRIYCGYICPIHTLTAWTQKFALRKKANTPSWIKYTAIRYTMLILLLTAMIVSMRSGKKLPVLPALTAGGVLLGLFMEESLWHRYLCPYGTVLSLFASRINKGYHVSADTCISCGKCSRICAANAISDKPALIDKSECLLCGRCANTCPVRAIYRV